MRYDFEKFTKTKSRYEDRITITASRSFGFPTKFYQDNNLARYKYVVLYYDKNNRAIGFDFTNDEKEKHKYSLIKSGGYGATVVATSFFKANNIDPKKFKGRYEWKRRNIKGIGQLFIINLEEEKLKPEKRKKKL